MAPLIHDLGTSWGYEVKFVPQPLYPRVPLGGSHSRSGLFAQEKFLGSISRGARGGVVVKALRYKPVGRGFNSRWCHWNFSVI